MEHVVQGKSRHSFRGSQKRKITKKGIQRASSDFGFAMVAYNLRRLVNIIGLKELKQYLESIVQSIFTNIALLKPFLSYFVNFKQQLVEETKIALLNLNIVKQNNITALQLGF